VFRPHLACLPDLARAFGGDVPGDVERLEIPLAEIGWVRAARRLAAYLRERRIDILHSHMFRGSLFASPVGRLCRVPVVLETSHGREAWRRGWRANYFIDRMANRCVNRTIAVSAANARYLVEEKRLPGSKVTVIHNGCDLDRFRPDHAAPEGMRAALRIGPLDPVLLVTGRLEPQKGHRFLLDAMREVRGEFPGARAILLGEGSLRGELERQAAALGLGDTVRFVGFQANVPDWLALADISVLPSLHEGLPLVAIESLAAGCPMVATAVDGTPEVVVNERTGLTVPPGEARSLAEAIRRLLGSAELRRRFAAAGRGWVLERFSRERQMRDTQELYLNEWQSAAHARSSRPVRREQLS
jgi:glycosyltransferase involved in cell wall biosynthesis